MYIKTVADLDEIIVPIIPLAIIICDNGRGTPMSHVLCAMVVEQNRKQHSGITRLGQN